MKYVVVLCDGMADEPLEELGGMTPLEKAHTPNLDRMAQISEIGMNLTDGMSSVCKMHAFFAFKGLGYSVNTL